ncbi:hypothetical protein EVAR_76532_1 [Eumeta japonica]|uniref:Uncharacterized protein n=1 Tax=Eumeta variegata TaxID=151549 RepID=A0A4C1T541_EUMVA|nr:hypothetical protein EVAR_76532_1 [Eumeta japonica]
MVSGYQVVTAIVGRLLVVAVGGREPTERCARAFHGALQQGLRLWNTMLYEYTRSLVASAGENGLRLRGGRRKCGRRPRADQLTTTGAPPNTCRSGHGGAQRSRGRRRVHACAVVHNVYDAFTVNVLLESVTVQIEIDMRSPSKHEAQRRRMAVDDVDSCHFSVVVGLRTRRLFHAINEIRVLLDIIGNKSLKRPRQQEQYVKLKKVQSKSEKHRRWFNRLNDGDLTVDHSRSGRPPVWIIDALKKAVENQPSTALADYCALLDLLNTPYITT